MNPLLKVEHLSYAYHSAGGETCALSDLSFQVEKGDILLDGKPVSQSRAAVGYMLQKDHLLEWRTIYQNAVLGLEIQHRLTEKNLLRVEQMLEDYGLATFKNARPSQLSGGMRQRAALIRTLAPNPALLLLDEPFSALDYLTRISVCDDIYKILKKQKKTAVMVTHDLSEAISVADRIIILSSRPAAIRKILPVRLSLEERTPLLSRSAPEFKEYFNLIWKELK